MPELSSAGRFHKDRRREPRRSELEREEVLRIARSWRLGMEQARNDLRTGAKPEQVADALDELLKLVPEFYSHWKESVAALVEEIDALR